MKEENKIHKNEKNTVQKANERVYCMQHIYSTETKLNCVQHLFYLLLFVNKFNLMLFSSFVAVSIQFVFD